MVGVTLAGLAEGMALADRAGLQQKDVMEVILEHFKFQK
jgi:3-hydroxyisobutyrate dehydrogenase